MTRSHTWSTVPRASAGLVSSAFAAVWLYACAGPEKPASEDWGPIPASEARLVLRAPGLDSPRTSFKRRVQGLTSYELGHWRPTTGTAAEAKLILIKLTDVAPSQMTFVREPPLEVRIRQWFASESIEIGSSGNARNVLGAVEYTRFTRDGAIQCVFVRQYGDTFADQRGYFPDGSTGHGDIMIRGYYCVSPFHELTASAIHRFVSGIGLEGFAVPAESRDLTLTAAPIAVPPAASSPRRPMATDAVPYAIHFSSMVLRTDSGQELADDLSEVSIDHGLIYVYVKWRGLTLGDHLARLRIFDGAGRRADSSEYRFSARSPYWNNWWSYAVDPDVDQPGHWRFEIDLDGEAPVDKELLVTAADYGPPRSGATKESRDAGFARYTEFDEGSGFKVFVQSESGAWAWRLRESAHSAWSQATRTCYRRSSEAGLSEFCEIFAVGNETVWHLPEKERREKIDTYSRM